VRANRLASLPQMRAELVRLIVRLLADDATARERL
jgi:hypothetical protein